MSKLYATTLAGWRVSFIVLYCRSGRSKSLGNVADLHFFQEVHLVSQQSAYCSYMLEKKSVVSLVSFRGFLKFLSCLISEFKKLLASGVILLLLQHFNVLPPYKQ